MKATCIQEHGQKTFAVVFDKDDECIAGLKEFAHQEQLTAAHFTAIGAFSAVTLGFFDRTQMDYIKIPITEQTEVLALVGNIALSDGQPKLHAHVVLGKSDGTAHGGHILEAYVWPTLEVVVVEAPAHLQRRLDQETGVPLLNV